MFAYEDEKGLDQPVPGGEFVAAGDDHEVGISLGQLELRRNVPAQEVAVQQQQQPVSNSDLPSEPVSPTEVDELTPSHSVATTLPDDSYEEDNNSYVVDHHHVVYPKDKLSHLIDPSVDVMVDLPPPPATTTTDVIAGALATLMACGRRLPPPIQT